MLSYAELREIREGHRLFVTAGGYRVCEWEYNEEVSSDWPCDVVRLLDEIERLADELDHWRKRATFAEQFIPTTPR